MAQAHGPKIATTGILMYLDASNTKSYSGSGTTWNSLTSGYNGTLVDGPTFTNNHPASYFTFDGTNDTMTTTIPITSTPALSDWSYEVWTSLTAWPTAVSPPNGFGRTDRSGVLLGAAYYSGAALYWYGNSSGNACTMYSFLRGNDAYRASTGYSMALNTIYQFVMVNRYSNNQIEFFVNGVSYATMDAATQEYNSSNISGAGNIGIARAQVDGGGESNYSHYPGRVYLARIYTNALTSSQVSQNFQALRGRFKI